MNDKRQTRRNGKVKLQIPHLSLRGKSSLENLVEKVKTAFADRVDTSVPNERREVIDIIGNRFLGVNTERKPYSARKCAGKRLLCDKFRRFMGRDAPEHIGFRLGRNSGGVEKILHMKMRVAYHFYRGL